MAPKHTIHPLQFTAATLFTLNLFLTITIYTHVHILHYSTLVVVLVCAGGTMKRKDANRMRLPLQPCNKMIDDGNRDREKRTTNR